ncbi:MAG: 5-formyltetrahydrofolate cyclo-ligase [Deltaproteobacteria bacterium]|nr:MAG: 5-formyltetrahydrofolate cyclo-ligase [Deltaproteobacteria bacterium]RUA03790.1 MAG: 5-formyltetrahydrofolate cyclo-ligase [Deltaproteobacteria bacterium]
MEEGQLSKTDIRENVAEIINQTPPEELALKYHKIQAQLFEFANFLESRIVLLFIDKPGEVKSRDIVAQAYHYNKIIVLPAFDPETCGMRLLKVDDPKRDLKKGPRGILEPDPGKCNEVPIECIDIAVIPGIAFDEKGGRIGSGEGYYDRLIPKLAITTRKVALSLEAQLVPLVPMESHDRYVDIIISEDRVIYKI